MFAKMLVDLFFVALDFPESFFKVKSGCLLLLGICRCSYVYLRIVVLLVSIFLEKKHEPCMYLQLNYVLSVIIHWEKALQKIYFQEFTKSKSIGFRQSNINITVMHFHNNYLFGSQVV